MISFAAHASHDLVAKVSSRREQAVDDGGEVVDLDGESIPAAGFLHATVRHRLPSSRRWIRRAEDEAEIAV